MARDRVEDRPAANRRAWREDVLTRHTRQRDDRCPTAARGLHEEAPPHTHTSNCHPRPRLLDARSRCRAIKRERNGKETQEVNPTESRPLCKRSQSSLCRPPAVRTTTKETETVRGCSPVTGNESSLPHTSGFRTCSSPAQGDLGDSPAVPIEERYDNKDVISQLSRWENDAPSRRRSRRVPCASSCSNL